MFSKNEWLVGTIGFIWVAVILTSLFSPDLVFGSDQTHMKIPALVNWLWGGLATAFVLRSTLFNPRIDMAYDGSDAFVWIGAAVGGIWLAVIAISLFGPDAVFGSDPVRIPVAALVSPIVGAVVTRYVSEFLVEGFAAIEERVTV